MQILLYHGEMCPSVVLSFYLLGLKCSQEEEKKKKETKLAEAWKTSLTAI